MARINKYANSSAGLAERLNMNIPSDTVTKEIVKELDAHPNVKVIMEKTDKDHETIYYAEPNQIDELFVPYKDEKLRLQLLSGERFERLKESVEKNGFFEPVICVPYDNRYMIVAGHNRTEIAKKLHVRLPYVVRTGLSESEMNEICMDTNLLNRQLSDYKPSQLAYAFLIKKQDGLHSDSMIELSELADTKGLLEDAYKLSKMQISRYVKLNDLIPSLLNRVDDGKLSIKIAYLIAFLPKDAQDVVYDYIDEIKNEKPIELLRREIRDQGLVSDDEITEYVKMRIPELCIRAKQKHVTDYRNLKPYIPSSVKPAEVEAYIIRALEAYNERALRE